MQVTAVDFSQKGLEKTIQLAVAWGGHEAASNVKAVCADIITYRPPDNQRFGAIVLSFCHVLASQRDAFMKGVVDMLACKQHSVFMQH
jgi:hypothetical protein